MAAVFDEECPGGPKNRAERRATASNAQHPKRTGGVAKQSVNEDDEIVSYTWVARKTSLSRTTIWRRVRDDISFPKPVDLGGIRVGFYRSEIENWLKSRRRLASLPTDVSGAAQEAA